MQQTTNPPPPQKKKRRTDARNNYLLQGLYFCKSSSWASRIEKKNSARVNIIKVINKIVMFWNRIPLANKPQLSVMLSIIFRIQVGYICRAGRLNVGPEKVKLEGETNES